MALRAYHYEEIYAKTRILGCWRSLRAREFRGMWPPLAALLPLGEALREKMLGAKLGSDSRPEGGLVSFCKSASLGEKEKIK